MLHHFIIFITEWMMLSNVRHIFSINFESFGLFIIFTVVKVYSLDIKEHTFLGRFFRK